MNVTLITFTPHPERLIAGAASLCYSSKDIDNLFNDLTHSKITELVTMLEKMEHESPFEHINFTFGVEGVSRNLTHQLVRHRIGASYSQKSQRYVEEKKPNYITPPEIEKDPVLNKCYKAHIELTYMLYNQLVENLIRNGRQRKQALEDARYVLPSAAESKIILTMNARSLFNFFEKRCCDRAQWEIRELAYSMLRLVKMAAPTVFKNAGPPCIKGPCREGSLSCGMPKKAL